VYVLGGIFVRRSNNDLELDGMKVELVEYTRNPEKIATMSALGCKSKKIPDLDEIDEDRDGLFRE